MPAVERWGLVWTQSQNFEKGGILFVLNYTKKPRNAKIMACLWRK